MKLLQAERVRRAAKAEEDRVRVRARLRAALARLASHGAVWVYGSVARPGKFHSESDVDLALEGELPGHTIYGLQSLLSEAVERSVDICVLGETRLAGTIRREGERWTW